MLLNAGDLVVTHEPTTSPRQEVYTTTRFFQVVLHTYSNWVYVQELEMERVVYMTDVVSKLYKLVVKPRLGEVKKGSKMKRVPRHWCKIYDPTMLYHEFWKIPAV
jgi:hypothetical protein